MDRTEWLAERRKGVTSTDIAAIAGHSPWATALDVYLDKLGLLPERPMNPQMAWGLKLEPLVAEAYTERTGHRLVVPDPALFVGYRPWMRATPDRLTEGSNLVELKTSRFGQGFGEEGTDDIPEAYILQAQWQMLVLDRSFANVAVLIGGSDFRVYRVERNTDLIQSLVALAGDFWRRVENRQPPEPDFGHPNTPKLLSLLHGLDEARTCTLVDSRADELATLYLGYGQEMKELELLRDAIRAELLYKMEGASVAHLSDGRRVVRRTVNRRAYQVEAGSYESFRIFERKD